MSTAAGRSVYMETEEDSYSQCGSIPQTESVSTSVSSFAIHQTSALPTR